ncbi:S24 family peptidase [Kushneria sp. TE3]|uniref:S24 family peptidase n=1 Tax=Kushneria sp. TE3 TaxID=3449832 RepID=UPI003F684952
MRVAYRMPMPTMVPKGEQDLAYNPAAERWQQFFAPHGYATFLAEVVQDDDAAAPWQEGDWLVVDPLLSLRDGVLVVVRLDEALYVYRYAHRINLPVLEGLDGQLWTGDLTNVAVAGVVSHQVRAVY